MFRFEHSKGVEVGLVKYLLFVPDVGTTPVPVQDAWYVIKPGGEQVTGAPPRTFRDFARKNAAAWSEAAT